MSEGGRRRPLLLAHRGDWRGSPENSLAALRAGAALDGLDGVEFDVRLASDGTPVVVHDETLDRVQGLPLRVADLAPDVLAFHGVPALETVLAELPTDRFLDVELKGPDHGAATAAVLRAARGERPAAAIVSSFDAPTLAAMRRELPGWPRWLNADDLAPETVQAALDLGCEAVAVDWTALDEEGVQRTRTAGLELAAWTVRSPDARAAVSAYGLVAICVEGTVLRDDPALRFEAGGVRMTVIPGEGGRIASLVVPGAGELLVTEGSGPIDWGCYPMAPWAGRVRRGRFSFAGRSWELEPTLAPHAIHGTVYRRPWQVDGQDTISADLGSGWPFEGRVIQRFSLEPGALRVDLELRVHAPMPATVGWHPWFRRRLDPRSAPVELAVRPAAMYRRDAEGIPDGTLVPPPPGPWDDCFTGLATAPVLTWPGTLALEIAADLDHWVLYTERPDAVCVEPQSGPPDALNLAPRIVEPGTPLRATMTWRWQRA